MDVVVVAQNVSLLRRVFLYWYLSCLAAQVFYRDSRVKRGMEGRCAAYIIIP